MCPIVLACLAGVSSDPHRCVRDDEKCLTIDNCGYGVTMGVAHSSAHRLLDAARRGDHRAQEELVRHYEPLVRRVVRRLRLPPYCPFDDLAQEARIGLLTALRQWRPERGPFAAFADRCATTQALRALDQACTRKHQVLNLAVSIEGDGMPFTSDPRADPECRLLVREQLDSVVGAVPGLTASERAALAGALNGHDPAWLRAHDGTTPKAAAQAVYRARRKLAAALGRAG